MKRTFIIHDIIRVQREVEIPLTCPQCNADLTQPDALEEWDLQDERADITMNAEGLVSSDYHWESGGLFLPVALYCARCDEAVVEGVDLVADTGTDKLPEKYWGLRKAQEEK